MLGYARWTFQCRQWLMVSLASNASSGAPVRKRHFAFFVQCIWATGAIVGAGYEVKCRLAKAVCPGGLCRCHRLLSGVGSNCWVYAGGSTTSASLPCAVLRLTAALVGAHGKDVGASGGLAVIAEVAFSWRPLLQQAPVQEVSPGLERALPCNSAAASLHMSRAVLLLTCCESLPLAFRHA